MSDFEDIQRLLRLKRYERPSDDFVEDFVHQFQHRQRQDLVRHSARGLLWERVSTYFEGLFAPTWRWAGATAVALLTVFMVFKPGTKDGALASAKQAEVSKDLQAPISDAEVERYLISKHFEGGLGDEPALIATDGQPASNTAPLPARALLPTGYIRQDVDMRGQQQR